MKKIFYLMSICALAFVSCQKEELAGNEAADGKYTYTFTVDHTAEAKASVGDKNGTQWPVLWSEGDQIGIYGGDTFYGTAVLTSGAGENTGVFTLNTSEELEIGGEYFVSYPYVEGAATKTGKVAAEHTLSASGIGANAFAYAYMDYEGDNTAFTLTHTNAYLKFNVSSEKFAGYQLTGVTLWASGAELSGAIEVGNGDAVTTTGDGDYVKTILSEPVTVSAAAQPVWLTALPCDLSAKTVYAIVHMTKGIETVTLPVKLNGAKALQAGAVTEITLPALTKSLAPSWYEPVETRYIAAYGKGWSYGPENTVLFEGETIEKTIDLKARGNFMEVKEPKNIKVLYVSDFDSKNTTNDILYVDGASVVQNSITEIGADYSVKVKMAKYNSYGHMSAILILDEKNNTLWGTNLWLSTTALTTGTYENGEVLDRNIGSGRAASNLMHYQSGGCFFQWGRPWAFPVSEARGTTKGNVSDVTSLSIATANPYCMYCYDGYLYDWYCGDGSKDRANDLDDLWGNVSSATKHEDLTIETSGIKSIYDPCPKGYRVMSPAIAAELETALNGSTITTGSALKDGTVVTSNGVAFHSAFESSGVPKYYRIDYKGISWGFAGGYFCDGNTSDENDGTTISTNKKNNKASFAAYWTNANQVDYGRVFWYQVMNTGATEWQSAPTFKYRAAKAGAYPIRCMVDTENR